METPSSVTTIDPTSPMHWEGVIDPLADATTGRSVPMFNLLSEGNADQLEAKHSWGTKHSWTMNRDGDPTCRIETECSGSGKAVPEIFM